MISILKILVTALSLGCVAQAMAQIPRHDVLECGLPGGSKFILKSRYLWIPINPNPVSSKTRERNESYKIYFTKKGLLSKPILMESELPGSVLYPPVREPEQAKRMCANFGQIGNIAFVDNDLVSVDGRRHYVIKPSKNMALTIGIKRRTPGEKVILKKFNVEPSGPFAMKVRPDGIFVSEQPLYDHQYDKIKAVFRSISRDAGQTWEPGVASTDAEIFELGNSLLEQSFIARPIRINGTKVDAVFPSPSKSEKPK